jgi:hypothetical protein
MYISRRNPPRHLIFTEREEPHRDSLEMNEMHFSLPTAFHFVMGRRGKATYLITMHQRSSDIARTQPLRRMYCALDQSRGLSREKTVLEPGTNPQNRNRLSKPAKIHGSLLLESDINSGPLGLGLT